MKNKTSRSSRAVTGGIILAAAVLGTVLGSCEKRQSEGASQIADNAVTAGFPRPFSYVDESGKLTGHNVELLEAVFARLPQYKLALNVADFPSMFSGLDADRYQIAANNLTVNEQRREKYLFSAPIFKNRHVIAVAKNDDSWGDEVSTLSDLAGKTTRGTVGTTMATIIESYNEAHPDAPIKQSFSDADLLVDLQQVESGQYDFNLIDKPLIEFYIREFGLNLKIIDLGQSAQNDVMPSPYCYFIAGKGNEKLVEDINKALAEVISDGTSKRICEKYFGSDYSPDISQR
jgi:polar amino acid transport system substrate-binding protein